MMRALRTSSAVILILPLKVPAPSDRSPPLLEDSGFALSLTSAFSAAFCSFFSSMRALEKGFPGADTELLLSVFDVFLSELSELAPGKT